jgi:uncharacterized protein with von Willebrand factor type A (vWA) domain
MERLATRSPCSDIDADVLQTLREVAKMQMGHGLDHDSKVMKEARERAQRRFDDARRRRGEASRKLAEVEAKIMARALEGFLDSDKDVDEILDEMGSSEERQRLQAEIESLGRESQRLTKRDLDDALSELSRNGFIDAKATVPRLTSKGARLLGQTSLSRVLENLARRGVGPHRMEEIGHGSRSSSAIRPYEGSDSYERLDIERSLLATLERSGDLHEMSVADFRVRESAHDTDVHIGILVDQSGSMNRQGKVEAAVETALALYGLMEAQFPEDRLQVFAFSEVVREVAHWELPRAAVPMKYTDVRAALRTFRLAVIQETGNRQVYLITDSAPNFEDGAFVGFDAALAGVLTEVRRYKDEDIVLNVVMLDEDPELKETARAIAEQNAGRVFFTRPDALGEVLMEDYLLSKRELLSL